MRYIIWSLLILLLPRWALSENLNPHVVETYYYKEDVSWGELANTNVFFDKSFIVTNISHNGRATNSPIVIKSNENLYVESQTHFYFNRDKLVLGASCTHYNSQWEQVDQGFSQVISSNSNNGSEYLVFESLQDTGYTDNNGIKCTTTLRPGKYILFKDSESLRLYADQDSYFELTEIPALN